MFRRWLSEDVEGTKVKRKKRVSPTVLGPGVTTTAASESSTPGYQYAVQEFQQTVPFGSIDDDGSSIFRTIDRELLNQQHQHDEAAAAGYIPAPDHTELPSDQSHPPPPPPPSRQTSNLQTHFSEDSQDYMPHQPTLYSPSGNYSYPYRTRQTFPLATHNMPDSAYEEWYGDAYLGGPIKYLYPAGYQSMRPRGGPWRLSIGICLLFTWLSVFIIGHCSDQVDQSLYGDADQVAIQTRWCGSKLLRVLQRHWLY